MGCVPCTLGFGSYFVGISAPLAADCVLLSVLVRTELLEFVLPRVRVFWLKKDLLVIVVNPS